MNLLISLLIITVVTLFLAVNVYFFNKRPSFVIAFSFLFSLIACLGIVWGDINVSVIEICAMAVVIGCLAYYSLSLGKTDGISNKLFDRILNSEIREVPAGVCSGVLAVLAASCLSNFMGC